MNNQGHEDEGLIEELTPSLVLSQIGATNPIIGSFLKSDSFKVRFTKIYKNDGTIDYVITIIVQNLSASGSCC